MKKILFVVFIYFLFASFSFAADWYKGGNLHESTIGQWHKASYQNRLATCSDWIVGVVDKKNHGMLFRDNMKVLRSLSEQLEQCITEGNKNNGKVLAPSIKSVESAAVCWTLMQNR